MPYSVGKRSFIMCITSSKAPLLPTDKGYASQQRYEDDDIQRRLPVVDVGERNHNPPRRSGKR